MFTAPKPYGDRYGGRVFVSFFFFLPFVGCQLTPSRPP